MEQREFQEKKYITIDAPEFLEVEQNLFEQEPFRTAIDGVAKASGEETAFVRSLLRNWLYYSLKNKEENIVANNLVARFKDYPLWEEYLRAHLSSREMFYANGERTKYRGIKSPPLSVRSYASWANIQLKAERNARLVGIEEIFPQDLKGEVPSLRPEKGPGYRRWVILKASEVGPSTKR